MTILVTGGTGLIGSHLLPSRFRLAILTNNNGWDTSRAEGELGCVADVGIQEGMAHAVQWWREYGWL
jgi:nucleoside-diphosphate-sugar epimerase